MFVGHCGPGFMAKKFEPSVPLWVLFLAVQFLDVLWAPFVPLGVEQVRIIPHFTASNALDLYYMPYTHGLLTALAWSVAAGVCYQLVARAPHGRAAALVGLAVFSHWILDFVVHVPDLPLYGNAANTFLLPPPTSDRAFAVTALIAYAAFALVAWLSEAPKRVVDAAPRQGI
jgi:hypothetical protein